MFRISSKKALGQELKCKIILLVPGEELEIGYTANSTGQDVLNEVVKTLDLLDRDYYGLKLQHQIQWLNLSKSVVKQTKGLGPVVLELRFKYYPAEPALLANESTRYYLYLQLRLDLIEGRLRSESVETLAFLIACILQSELGDYSSGFNGTIQDNYVSEFKFVPNQSEELELEAIRLHQNEDFKGLKPADSELNFLKKSCQLDTYGIDPYPVKEGNSHNHFLIGVNHKGISSFQDSKITHSFSWDEIERITIDNKLVLIYCRKVEKRGDKSSKSKLLFGFRCPSPEYAHNFWRLAVEHRYFFTLESTPDLPIVTNTGGLFRKSHKLKYIGRVEKDLLRDHVDEYRSSGVKRTHSLMSKTSDGSRWQGFQQGNNLQSSMNNIYAADVLNKTSPANMNYFAEEDEQTETGVQDITSGSQKQSPNSRQSVTVFSSGDKKRLSTNGSLLSKDSPKTFTRRTVLTTKTEAGRAIRRGSQIYLDTEQQTHDVIKTTIFLILLLVLFLITLLLINDPDRPNSVSFLVKKMNLESVSLTLRKSYYLPLKSALGQSLGQIVSIFDSRLL